VCVCVCVCVCVYTLLTSVLCLVSCVPCPVSSVLCRVSSVLCPLSCVLCPVLASADGADVLALRPGLAGGDGRGWAAGHQAGGVHDGAPPRHLPGSPPAASPGRGAPVPPQESSGGSPCSAESLVTTWPLQFPLFFCTFLCLKYYFMFIIKHLLIHVGHILLLQDTGGIKYTWESFLVRLPLTQILLLFRIATFMFYVSPWRSNKI